MICDADKKAAVYDYGMCQVADRRHEVVVYLAVEGPVPQSSDFRIWLSKVVARQSKRAHVSTAPAAVSMLLPPAQVGTAVNKVRRALASRGLKVRRLD
jgi:hypothetical protein